MIEIIKNKQTPRAGKYIDVENDDHKIIMEDVLNFLKTRPNLLGLAANQLSYFKIDRLEFRFFCWQYRNSSGVIINPVIIEYIGAKYHSQEGCASWPHQIIIAQRYREILVEYETMEGEKKRSKISGLMAYVFQHEIDHLNGVEEKLEAKKFQGQKGKQQLIKLDVPGRNDLCSCGSGKKYKKCCFAY